VQKLRKNLAAILIVVATVAIAGKYYMLSGIEGWSFDLLRALINLALTACMISVPVYFARRADSANAKPVPSRLMGFAVAFTVFMFYVLLFVARLFMMMEYYAQSSTMLTFEFILMALLLAALVYPVVKQSGVEQRRA